MWDKVKEEIREFQTEVAHMDKEKLKLNSAMSCSASSTLPPLQNQSGQCAGTDQPEVHQPLQLCRSAQHQGGQKLHDMTLEEMDKLWNEAKVLEKEGKQDDSSKGQV